MNDHGIHTLRGERGGQFRTRPPQPSSHSPIWINDLKSIMLLLIDAMPSSPIKALSPAIYRKQAFFCIVIPIQNKLKSRIR